MHKNSTSLYSNCVICFLNSTHKITIIQFFLMMYYVGLYYNLCVLELLGYEFRTKKNTNASKAICLLFVYSTFLSFLVPFQHKKLSKWTNLFWLMPPIILYYKSKCSWTFMTWIMLKDQHKYFKTLFQFIRALYNL
jgi:hypothetical protein